MQKRKKIADCRFPIVDWGMGLRCEWGQLPRPEVGCHFGGDKRAHLEQFEVDEFLSYTSWPA